MPIVRQAEAGPLIPSHPRQAEIPRGVADYFWTEAFARRQLEETLLRLFRTWGYEDVIPPMFEYADTYQGRSSPKLQAELYRFLDRDGSTLALRGDMTIPVARLVGVRLHDRPMPQRYCYAGSVFRYTEPQAGRKREFWQSGCELIGANTPEADAEILALTVHALAAAGLRDFRLVMGQIQYFHGLLQDLNLTPAQAAVLRQAIDRNSEAQLADFLDATPLQPQQRQTVEQLPQLSGTDVPAIIAQAERLCLNQTMQAALDNLSAIHAVLAAYDMADVVSLDLTEINYLGYYTGITFEVLTHHLGFALGSGGRYDNLIATFGPRQPAVGVALGIDRILLARTTQDQASLATQPVGPDLLVATANDPACFRIVESWRQTGLRVAISLLPGDHQTVVDAAQQAGARLALSWDGTGFDISDPSNPTATPTRLPAASSSEVIDLLARRAPAVIRRETVTR